MKKLIVSFICLQSIFTFGQAPAIQWQKTYGGTSSDVAIATKQTTDDGYISAGYTYSSDGDVTNNQGDNDYWIVKYDVTGNIVWQKTYGGTSSDIANSIQQTTDGGYIVAGYTLSSDGDVIGNHGSIDCWVLKLDAAGTIIWQKTYGGTGSDKAESIQQTADGGYIIMCTSNSNNGDVTDNHGNYDYWVVKTDATGNIIWQKSYGGTSIENGREIKQTVDGGYIMIGQSYSNNGDVTGNHGNYDYWVVKTDATGNIIWQKSYGGSGLEDPSSIIQTTDGGYIAAGRSASSNGDLTNNNGGSDFWIVKLDVAGTIIWQKNYGGPTNDNAQSIQQTSNGGYIVAGNVTSNGGDVVGFHGGSYNDGWILRLDVTGTILWQKTLGGTADDVIYDAQQTIDGGYIASGYSHSSDGDLTSNNGSSDFWIIKLESDCPPVTHTISETACGSFTWTAGNGQTYNTSTTATHTFIGGAANGCDSIVTLNLTVNQPTNSSFAVTECEPYTWPLNNQTYTTSGAYTHVIPNANNCDSTITLNLTINQPTSSTITQTACGSYTLNGQTYTSSGTYTQVVSNAASCDSTITLNLTINDVNATVTASGIVLTVSQSGATYQWIDCDNNDTPIAGATSQSFTPTQNGNYAVTITANGCTETSDCMPVNSVGIETVEQNDWSVYPNPGNGLFMVQGESLSTATIKVMNYLGQELTPATTFSNDILTIDLGQEASGVYLLEIYDGKSSITIRLLKQQ